MDCNSSLGSLKQSQYIYCLFCRDLSWNISYFTWKWEHGFVKSPNLICHKILQEQGVKNGGFFNRETHECEEYQRERNGGR